MIDSPDAHLYKQYPETEQTKTRFQICKSCEKLKELKICGECGCFMPLKVLIPTMKCPLNKW